MPDCLADPTRWLDIIGTAARCTGTDPEQALRLAGLGGVVVLLPLVLLALGLALRVRRTRSC